MTSLTKATTEAQFHAAANPVCLHLAVGQCRFSGKTQGADRSCCATALLQDVAAAERILCLTYTKGRRVSEMQNRLFKRLGEWAMKPDADVA